MGRPARVFMADLKGEISISLAEPQFLTMLDSSLAIPAALDCPESSTYDAICVDPVCVLPPSRPIERACPCPLWKNRRSHRP